MPRLLFLLLNRATREVSMRVVEPSLWVPKRLSVPHTQTVVALPSARRRTTSIRTNQRLASVLTWAARVAIALLSLSQIAPLAQGQGGCSPPTSAAKMSPVAATVLPSGTVQFRTIGVSDPIVWSVNGNEGGSPTSHKRTSRQSIQLCSWCRNIQCGRPFSGCPRTLPCAWFNVFL
jgi:hypothetical protein